VGRMEIEGASGVVFAEAGAGEYAKDFIIWNTLFAFGLNEFLLPLNGAEGGDENELNTILLGGTTHGEPGGMRFVGGLKGFVTFLEGDEVCRFDLWWKWNQSSTCRARSTMPKGAET